MNTIMKNLTSSSRQLKSEDKITHSNVAALTDVGTYGDPESTDCDQRLSVLTRGVPTHIFHTTTEL